VNDSPLGEDQRGFAASFRSAASTSSAASSQAGRALGRLGPARPLLNIFTGVVSFTRLSFHAAAPAVLAAKVRAGVGAACARARVPAAQQQNVARIAADKHCTLVELVLVECFRAAEATQGSVVAAVGDEIVMAGGTPPAARRDRA
jgi:hypothetical protein